MELTILHHRYLRFLDISGPRIKAIWEALEPAFKTEQIQTDSKSRSGVDGWSYYFHLFEQT